MAPDACGQRLERGADRLLPEPPSVVGEKELGRASVTRVWQRPAVRSGVGYVVDQLQDLFIERDHPLGVQFAEGDFQPAAVAGDLVEAVQVQGRAVPLSAAQRNVAAASWPQSVRFPGSR